MHLLKFKKTYLAILCSLFLSSCSGGGGGDGSNTVGTKKENKQPNIPVSIPSKTESSGKIKVGVVDSGAVANSGVLYGAISKIINYTLNDDGTQTKTDIALTADDSVQDTSKIAHGSFVSSVIAGNTTNDSQAGLAEGEVSLYEAQDTKSSDGTSNLRNNILAMQDLQTNYGVQIFNNSWGSESGEPLDSNNLSTMNNLVKNGALLIFSTGNDGKKAPSDESVAPVSESGLLNGFIAVTGVDKAANQCGAAAAWCISGSYTSSAYYIQKLGGLYYYQGTSGAAPQITAEAALVWKNFDWMTNKNVKYTILTTATYYDDGSGVSTPYNSTYGWGYYNIGKAEKGPGMFSSYLGDFEADVPSGETSTFSNSINGDAGLVKDGAGTLILSGADTYTGNTVINNGVLSVTSSLDSDVTVNSSGLLEGSGLVQSLTNNGNVSTTQGKITVNGDYTQGHSGTLQYFVGNPLQVNGNVSLDGSLKVLSNDNLFTDGDYDVITGKSLTGTFSSTDSGSSFVKLNSITYNNTSAVANVSLVDASTAGTDSSSSSSAVGGAMVNQLLKTGAAESQTTTDSSSSKVVSLAKAVEFSSSAVNAQDILDSNTGVIYAEQPSVLIGNQSLNTKMLSNHLYQTTQNNNEGVWINQTGMTTKNKAAGWNTVSTSNYNSTIGGDKRINDSLLLGLSATKSELNSKVDHNGGQGDIRLTSFDIYGKYQKNNTGAYLEGSLSYGFGNTEVSRSITTGTNSYYTKNSTNVKTSNAYVETGYDKDFGKFKVSPFVGVEYNYAHINRIQEDNDYGLTASANSQQQLSMAEGVRANYQFTSNVAMQGFVARSDVLNRNQDKESISLNADSNISTTYNSPDFENVNYMYGVGETYTPSKNWLFDADMIGYSGRSSSYMLSLGMKYIF